MSTWNTAGPRERANMVRGHTVGQKPLTTRQLCDLFDLTVEGLDAILDGADWKPEYERAAVNYIEGGGRT